MLVGEFDLGRIGLLSHNLMVLGLPLSGPHIGTKTGGHAHVTSLRDTQLVVLEGVGFVLLQVRLYGHVLLTS